MAIGQDFFDTLNPTSDSAATQVWMIDDPAGTPVFVDETVDFNDVGAGDVVVWPATEVAGDQLAIGFTSTFGGVNLNVGTAGTVGTMLWKYWNGTAWSTFAGGVTDGTTGLTVSGANDATWAIPSDWAALSLNGSADLFYVVLEVATAFTIDPVLDQGFALSGFSAAPPVDLSFIGTQWELYLHTGTGPVEFSFNGQDVHGVLDSSERSLVTREDTSRNVLWLRSVAGTESVEVHAWV